MDQTEQFQNPLHLIRNEEHPMYYGFARIEGDLEERAKEFRTQFKLPEPTYYFEGFIKSVNKSFAEFGGVVEIANIIGDFSHLITESGSWEIGTANYLSIMDSLPKSLVELTYAIDDSNQFEQVIVIHGDYIQIDQPLEVGATAAMVIIEDVSRRLLSYIHEYDTDTPKFTDMCVMVDSIAKLWKFATTVSFSHKSQSQILAKYKEILKK